MPAWVHVARSQHVLLLQSGRVWFLFGLLVMALVIPDVLRMVELARGPLPNTPLGPVPAAQQLFWYSIAIAPIWALLVWRAETRGRRTYHWSLPVRHPAHDLWRVAAGATWLTAMLIAIMPLAIALAVLGDTPRLFRFGPQFWINLITLPLLVYLVSSLVPMLVRRPLTVALRIVVGGVALLSLAVALRTSPFVRVVPVIPVTEWLVEGRFGAQAALFGGLEIARSHAFELEGLRRHDLLIRDMSAPTTAEFLVATALWLTLAAVGVALAARRAPA